MTPRQVELYDFIRDFTDEMGYPPTFDEMRCALGLKSKENITRILNSLEEKGKLRRDKARARSVEILDDPRNAVVAAAKALLASINVENEETGFAVIGYKELGDLDVAIAELDG